MMRLAAIVFIGGALVGCGATAPEKINRPPPTTQQESGVGVYLETLNRLANGNAAQQADVFYEVERDYTGAPTTANSLRYAVALVTPGHPSANLADGKKLLERLLATPERLTAGEKNLAGFLVKDADARLQFQAEVRRLAATVDERTRGQANLGSRMQSQMQSQTEEIARLRKQLDDAQQKLDAIKSMEKSIVERNTPPPTGRESPR